MLRFHLPLIEPDGRISRIRLSDWLHRKVHDDAVKTRSSPSPLGKVAAGTLEIKGVARPRPIASLCPFRQHARTEAPSLHRHYPASSLLRASPPPRTARPSPHGVPVEGPHPRRRGFPCCARSPCADMPMFLSDRQAGQPALRLAGLPAYRTKTLSPLPRRNRCAFSLILHSNISLPSVPKVGFRVSVFEACSAFTHVTACRFARSPSDPLHRRLRRLRCLRHRSDCYWLERELPGGTSTR